MVGKGAKGGPLFKEGESSVSLSTVKTLLELSD